jgi:transketolase
MSEKIIKLKRLILQTAVNNKSHIPSAFSILDIIWILYDKVLNVNKNNIYEDKRDRFILSKGHGCLALYVVLAEKGFFSKCELSRFGTKSTILGGHPDRNKIPGIEVSTGSLGHGLPISIGIALALKIKKKSSRVYTLIGDGEANEGTIWESALLAAHHKLNNLYCIIDNNRSSDKALAIGDLGTKFKSFGWDTSEINGHDHQQIYRALIKTSHKPKAIAAQTIKGYGCRFLENKPEWHYRYLSQQELPTLMSQLY